MTTGNIAELIAVIATGGSLAQAAQASDMSVRTAQRRLQEPEVALAVEEARMDLTRQALGELTKLRTLVFGRLRQVLSESDETAHVLTAADMVLRHAAAAHVARLSEDVLALEYQVSALREHLQDRPKEAL